MLPLSTTVNFTVKKSRKNAEGKSPIMASISANCNRIYMFIGKSVYVSRWNDKKQSVTGHDDEANDINKFLSSFRHQVAEKEIELVKRGYLITPELLKEALMGHIVDLQSKTLLQLLDEHNSTKEKLIGKTIVQDTYNDFIRGTKLLTDFIKHKYQREDMLLSEICYGFISDFHTYLLTETNMRQNTAAKYLKFLKKIMNDAVSHGYISFNKLQPYRIEKEPVNPEFLTEDELRKIVNFNSPYKHLERTRDMFLFSCFTGLAYIDIKTLTKDNLERDNEGRLWIKKNRVKTGVLSRIPVLPYAKMLIDKYHDEDSDYVMPIPCASDVNEYIKVIAMLCGINKRIVFHTARHTFATTVTLSNNISLEVVSKMLGHTNTKMTTHYARMVDKCIAEQMDKLQNMFDSISTPHGD